MCADAQNAILFAARDCSEHICRDRLAFRFRAWGGLFVFFRLWQLNVEIVGRLSENGMMVKYWIAVKELNLNLI